MSNMHPRNRHAGSYDFAALTKACPELSAYVTKHPGVGRIPTIDFANPPAVKALNRALLAHYYGITQWDIPPGYLCPPIPGRAEYIHQVADLLKTTGPASGGAGPGRVLDIGVGANCVYPIIGHAEYGWHFTGADIDPVALENARQIIDANKPLRQNVELRLQPNPSDILRGIIEPGDYFDLTICNPPFHASMAEATKGTNRKLRNLSKGSTQKPRPAKTPTLNFGGHGAELWCPGGELAFIRKLIEQSPAFKTQVRWFTTLVSKESNLSALNRALKISAVSEARTLHFSLGQKKTRILCWTYQPAPKETLSNRKR